MKIGIAHRNVVAHDAIGNDIMGMRDVLVEGGFEVDLIGQHFDGETAARAQTVSIAKALLRQDLSLLIYHHSIYWEHGETLLRKIKAPRMMKYHNVTPPDFFEGYSQHYEALCAAGRDQTRRLLGLFDEFAADSTYNAAELMEAGAQKVSVVPPFTKTAPLTQDDGALPAPPFSALFVGRRAPHKGHLDLLSIVAAYVAEMGPAIKLNIVGGTDYQLDDYSERLQNQIDALGIRDNVRIIDTVDADMLRRLYAESSVFLCMSEHEGFCVPIIESQASGLPVISVNATALEETIGPGQLVVGPPRTKADFRYIAHLLHAVCTNEPLRRRVVAAGYRNVLARFNPSTVADRFMGSLAPILERIA